MFESPRNSVSCGGFRLRALGREWDVSQGSSVPRVAKHGGAMGRAGDIGLRIVLMLAGGFTIYTGLNQAH